MANPSSTPPGCSIGRRLQVLAQRDIGQSRTPALDLLADCAWPGTSGAANHWSRSCFDLRVGRPTGPGLRAIAAQRDVAGRVEVVGAGPGGAERAPAALLHRVLLGPAGDDAAPVGRHDIPRSCRRASARPRPRPPSLSAPGSRSAPAAPPSRRCSRRPSGRLHLVHVARAGERVEPGIARHRRARTEHPDAGTFHILRSAPTTAVTTSSWLIAPSSARRIAGLLNGGCRWFMRIMLDLAGRLLHHDLDAAALLQAAPSGRQWRSPTNPARR